MKVSKLSALAGFFFIIAVTFAVSVSLPNNVSAQGQSRCQVAGGACSAVGSSCVPGYMPSQSYCNTWNTNLPQCGVAPLTDCIPDPNFSLGCFRPNNGQTNCIPAACNLGGEYPDLSTCVQNCANCVGAPQCFRVTIVGGTNQCVSVGCTEPGALSLPDCLVNCGADCQAAQAQLNCSGANTLNTAIGCIPYGDVNALAAFFLRWALGFAGGIALLLIGVAGFQLMTSSGDPRKLQAGKELLSSAIIGLLLIIFSAFLLRVIGVDILGIL